MIRARSRSGFSALMLKHWLKALRGISQMSQANQSGKNAAATGTFKAAPLGVELT